MTLSFLPFILTYSYLHHQKKQIKREIKRQIISGLEKRDLVLLKFNAEELETQLKWEHSKEFEFKGEMYDIVSSEKKNDTTYFYCWWDNDETQLNKTLRELVLGFWGTNNDQKEKQNSLKHYAKNLFHSSTLAIELLAPFSISEKLFTKENQGFYLVSLDLEIPPPKMMKFL